jgi:hypothetical protein
VAIGLIALLSQKRLSWISFRSGNGNLLIEYWHGIVHLYSVSTKYPRLPEH